MRPSNLFVFPFVSDPVSLTVGAPEYSDYYLTCIDSARIAIGTDGGTNVLWWCFEFGMEHIAMVSKFPVFVATPAKFHRFRIIGEPRNRIIIDLRHKELLFCFDANKITSRLGGLHPLYADF